MSGWVPPLPLACGALAFGLSWVALFLVARGGSFAPAPMVFAWTHLVVLGWITLVALTILLHALPAFLDVTWQAQRTARVSILTFAAGVAILLAGFFGANSRLLEIGATVVLLSLAVYLATVVQPLRAALAGERVQRAVARAFCFTFVMLLLTALLGAAFAYVLGGALPANGLEGAAQAHAFLGIGGWLTLLVFGISARTMGPIAGARSNIIALHIASGSAVALGTLCAAFGAGTHVASVLLTGCCLLVIGAGAYALDIGSILRRATVTHRPPQAWMACASLWAVVAAVLVLCAALGEPWVQGGIYLALIGWIGSAVMAHLHHIGVRVLLTSVRGEDDETRPQEVLITPLTWVTFAFYEIAAVAGCFGILISSAVVVEIAALCGLIAFVTMVANLSSAMRRAASLPIVLGV